MKMKYLWIPFAVFLAALLPLRLYQVLYLIDPATGFSTGSPYMLQILLGLVALFVLVLIFMSILCKNAPEHIEVKKNVVAGGFAFLSAISLLAESAYFLRDFIFSPDRTPPSLIQALLGMLAAAVLAMMAVCSFTGRNLLERIPIITLLPTVWCCVRLVFSFLSYTNIATNSSDMLDLLSTSFLLLFFYTQAKLLAGFTTSKSGKWAVVLGMSAVVLLVVFRAPAVVQMISAGSFRLEASFSYVTDLLLACYLFIITIGHTVQLSRVSAPEPKEAAAAVSDERPDSDSSEILRPLFFDSLIKSGAPAGSSKETDITEQSEAEEAERPIPYSRQKAAARLAEDMRSMEEKRGKVPDMEKIDRLIQDICREREITNIIQEKDK